MVLELVIVGFCEVLQQTPLVVTALPPSEEIAPPLVAETDVRAETCVVVTVGITGTASFFFLHAIAKSNSKLVVIIKLILFIGFGFLFSIKILDFGNI